MNCPVHWYHAYADGSWREPVVEHFAALGAAGWDWPITVSVIGTPEHRAQLIDDISFDVNILEFDSGDEALTLQLIRDWAKKIRYNEETPVLYAHTKGAYSPSTINTQWRRSMTHQLVSNWDSCTRMLYKVDAVGCHWLQPQEFPGMVIYPYFAGNFWWAKSSYLRGLQDPLIATRYDAEVWIGSGHPTVIDLMPGWPGQREFGPKRFEAT